MASMEVQLRLVSQKGGDALMCNPTCAQPCPAAQPVSQAVRVDKEPENTGAFWFTD